MCVCFSLIMNSRWHVMDKSQTLKDTCKKKASRKSSEIETSGEGGSCLLSHDT